MPDSADERLRAFLASLSTEDLVERLVAVAADDLSLRGRLLAEAATHDRSGVDVKAWKAAARATILLGNQGYTDYAYTAAVDAIVEDLGRLVAEGRAAVVVDLAEYALRLVEQGMSNIDDSNGHYAGIVENLETVHLDACHAARPDPVKLAERLFSWQVDGGWDTFDDAFARYAEVLGEGGQARYRTVAADRWATVAPLRPGDDDRDRFGSRLRISRVMESIARADGDVDALVAVMARDQSSPYCTVQIVEVLLDAGRVDEALDWAERGVAAHGRRDSRPVDALASCYQRVGRGSDAVAVMHTEFEQAPSLRCYQRLASHAQMAKVWEAERLWALDVIRAHIAAGPQPAPSRWAQPAFADGSVLVEVLLWEGHLEQAWAEAKVLGCRNALWLALADVREAEHPADVIPILEREVDQILAKADKRAYAAAVRVLERLQGLHRRLGQPEVFTVYVARVRQRHKAKKNLMILFDRRQWT